MHMEKNRSVPRHIQKYFKVLHTIKQNRTSASRADYSDKHANLSNSEAFQVFTKTILYMYCNPVCVREIEVERKREIIVLPHKEIYNTIQ